jgi:adenylate kinase family enzyme
MAGGMKRVMVIGPGGAGKSTFARRLGERTGLPVIHLDEHHWRPGWEETPKQEWRAIVTDLAAGDEWIIDGNYGGTIDVRVGAADTAIFLDYAPLPCVARALRRSILNYGRAVQAPGCKERVDVKFLRWIAHYRRDSRPRALAQLEAGGSHLELHVLRHPRDAQRFLEGVPEAAD